MKPIAIVVIAVLGVAGAAAWMLHGRGGDDAPTIPTFIVAHDSLVRRVTADGNLRAVKATPLTVPKTSGEGGGMKIAWLASDGSRVRKDDVVVKFDPTDPQKRLADGRADLESADAQAVAEQIKSRAAVAARDGTAALASRELEQRRKFRTTDKDIFSRHQIVESEIDEKLATARKDHAERTKQVERSLSRSKAALIVVEQNKAKLAIEHATSALESMEIRAPHDGIFVLQRNWRGEAPKIGDQLWPGQAVAEIPLLDAMEVEAFVLEIDGDGLAVNQPAEITIEARPDTVYRGKVRLVDKLAKPRVDGVPIQYFEVVVALDRTDAAVMKPGQRVHARLTLDQEHALVVPRQAILAKDGKNFVYRRTPSGEFEAVIVGLGAATSGRVVVKTGLATGDAIALRDPTRSLDQALGSGSAPGPATPTITDTEP